MKYRNFPNTDIIASALGMGCMRLPTVKSEGEPIDFPEAQKMLRHAIDSGVTYVDTAWGYHGGKSEEFLGEALSGGYRERVTLTTKLPCWKVEKREDMDELLNTQLARLKTDHVDFYLLHALNANSFDKMVSLGVFEFLDSIKADGRARYVGFSFHDDYKTFVRIVDSYPFNLAQVQMNVLDEFKQATLEGVKYAASKGMGVVVMEPLRGGALVKSVPDNVREVYDGAEVRRSPAEWAFRWLIDRSDVVTILSGMSSMEQLDDNLRIFDSAEAGCLTDCEREMLTGVREAYESRVKIGCTGCEYCQPCPAGVPIPKIFRPYDQAAIFENLEQYMKHYGMELGENKCVGCGKCEKACPQKIQVRDWLKEIQREYEETKK